MRLPVTIVSALLLLMTEMSEANSFVLTIRSGGETGVDRAALDAVLNYNATKNLPNLDNNAKKSSSSLSVQVTGWCPKGRLADEGEIPSKYPLNETPNKEFSQKIEWNVRDADATLVLSSSTTLQPDTGTNLTLKATEKMNKPCLPIFLDGDTETKAGDVLRWMNGNNVKDLNVAGPCESYCPGIHANARHFVTSLLEMFERNNEAGLLLS